jgi:hypothetical protein
MLEGSPRTNTLANTAHWFRQIKQIEAIVGRAAMGQTTD